MKLLLIILLLPSLCFSQEVSMKDYVDAQVKNIENNVTKATVSMDRRLDGMNEFRETLKDQAGTFITRSELFAWVIALLGVFFAYSNYKVNIAKQNGKAIHSGDKVEVNKKPDQ